MRHSLKTNICNLPSYGTQRREIDIRIINQHLPPELKYSCHYWTQHLLQSKYPITQMDDAFSFLQDHFLHWLEVMSILGIISEAVGMINTLQSIIQVSSRGKFYVFISN